MFYQNSFQNSSYLQNTSGQLNEKAKRLDDADAEKGDINERLKRKERDLEELRNEIDEQKAALDKSEKNRQRLQGNHFLFFKKPRYFESYIDEN